MWKNGLQKGMVFLSPGGKIGENFFFPLAWSAFSNAEPTKCVHSGGE